VKGSRITLTLRLCKHSTPHSAPGEAKSELAEKDAIARPNGAIACYGMDVNRWKIEIYIHMAE
jgi:hypothetical protein